MEVSKILTKITVVKFTKGGTKILKFRKKNLMILKIQTKFALKEIKNKNQVKMF